MKNRDGFTTNKEELIFNAQKIFNFSFPAIPSTDLKLHKYKELEESNIYYLSIEHLFDREISRKQEWKISSNLEFDNNLYGEYKIETNDLYNTILKLNMKNEYHCITKINNANVTIRKF